MDYLEKAILTLEQQMDDCYEYGIDIDDNGQPDILMRCVNNMQEAKDLIQLARRKQES